MAPVHATITSEVTEKLDLFFRAQTTYLAPSDEEYLAFCAEIDKVAAVDGAVRSSLRARLSALTGDRAEAEYYLRNAQKLHVDQEEHDLAQATVLSALGYFSELLKVVHACGKQDNIVVFLRNHPAGQFHLIQEFHQRATQMNLANMPALEEKQKAVVPIMDLWGDTDADYAAALDFAGMVMRKHRLFALDSGLIVEPVTAPRDGGLPYVKLAFPVDVDLETSIDMTCEYSELLARSEVKIPQSMIFEFLPNQE